MATRLVFLCHAATRSMREGSFPDPDEPADAGGLVKARALVLRPSSEAVFVAPALVAHHTAQAMGLAALVAPDLADLNHGVWRGRSLAEVQAADPEALSGWMANPASGAPGGESFASLQTRVSAWIQTQAGSDQRILAITHQTVMRAALAHVLEIPPSAAFRVDIAPLSMLTLSFNRRWRFQGLGGKGVST